jgi:hypothetical protein
MAGDPSMPASVIDDMAGAKPGVFKPAVIRRAFRQLVRDADAPNKSISHYVLRRLGARQDDTAVDYCCELLGAQPEETGEVLRYFEALNDSARFESTLAAVLRDADLAMYPYQRYLILDWIRRVCKTLHAPAVRAVRAIEQDSGNPEFLRMQATAILGMFGSHADLERTVHAFGQSANPLARAQLLCSLSRLEVSRRNSMLGRVKDEQPWVSRAVSAVRGASV